MSLTNRRRVWRWSGVSILGVFLLMNFIAYRQARGLIQFAPSDQPPRRKGWQADLLGVELPRPMNSRKPTDLGLSFETRSFPGALGERIEAWIIPASVPSKGTVIGFHGHAGSKEGLLPAATQFHALGWDVWLVDSYGSGGSTGNSTSIGWHEAEDVRTAFQEVMTKKPKQPIVLYGVSMGAASVLRSVAVHDIQPAVLVLECPFDRLRTTVANRFHREGFPTFPMLDLILFWGGVQQGFNPYQHNPVDYASRVRCPTLLMQGDSDKTIALTESQSIAKALGSRCIYQTFEHLGHESLLGGNRELWKQAVAQVLNKVLEPE